MLLSDVSITDEDIAYAERLILGTGNTFSDEQKEFIRNISTIDLQAVPGSGKTTAVIAKLLILSKALPFDDGSGVLVISHTNNAVDHFGRRLQPHCPHLFRYPNFIGTIQGFTDAFLAIPYFTGKYQRQVYRIDDETYVDRVRPPAKAAGWLKNRSDQDKILRESRLINDDTLSYGVSGDGFPLSDHQTATYRAIVEMKQKLRQRGILCFDDAYILAFEYLEKFPRVKQVLRKRFPVVLVDEMQDMCAHQYRLLEEIFYGGGYNDGVVYQRIGDKNQAIYTSDAPADDVWQDRGTILRLSSSRRLSPSIAKTVQCFGISNLKIVGTERAGQDLQPHIIVYDDNTVKDVIPRFCSLFDECVSSEHVPSDLKYPIKAIAWRKDTLKQFFPAFESESVRHKQHHPNLFSHLEYGWSLSRGNGHLGQIHRSIGDALVHILFLEGVDIRTANSQRSGSVSRYRRLTGALRDHDPTLHDEFLLKVFRWSRDVRQGKLTEVHKDIRDYIPAVLASFGRNIDKCSSFLAEIPASQEPPGDTILASNVYSQGGIAVDVGTVHSVKGETHTATLYIESSYYGKHETEWLAERFGGNFSSLGTAKRAKQCTKVLYVGFSRPTHLLCYAIHRDRFDQNSFGDRWAVIADLVS